MIIEENQLSANLSTDPITGILTHYTYLPTTPPCYAPGQTVSVIVNSGGGSPNSYLWFKETQLLSAPNTNTYATNTPGAFWVQLSNNKYCYKNINPKPAVVSFKYPVQAIITGVQDVCAYETFTLKGPTGTGLSYSWVRNPGNIFCGNTRIITQNLMQDNYTYTLSLSQAGGCSSVSSPYHVNVHAMPVAPTISLSVIDCLSYILQLDAYSGIGSNFNWSNGQNGSTIHITHGGPYRVWINDQYGCKNYADIDVPLAPSAYFWRFPTGCYSYCPGELPKWVDGPSHTSFNYWEWRIANNGNTSIVSPNNNLNGFGSNSICNPLWLDQSSLGSGSGDYSWILDNGLCQQESDFMVVDMKEECCDVKISDIKINCNPQTGNYDVVINIDNNTPGCNTTFYNLSILAPGSLVSIYNFNSQSPSSLIQGINQIIATIQGNSILGSTNTPVVIKIETLCNSWEHCVGYIDAIIPECKYDFAINKSNTEAETIYISDLNLAPNPGNTEVYISYRFTNDNITNSRTIQVYDAVGRPISDIKIGNANGTYKLDVSRYTQGIYFVEIRENNNHVLTKRMLINH